MARLGLIIFALALALVSPRVGFAANPKVKVFDGGMNQVFDATLKAVEGNWKRVSSSDRAAGTIKFHTGVSMSTWGENCIAILRDLGNGKIEVSLKSENSGPQLYAWGVGGRIAQKLFKSIQREISTSSSASQSSSPASAPKK